MLIRDDAIEASADFGARYISGRFLPDKAIDLLDTACARVKVSLASRPAPLEDAIRRAQAGRRECAALERDRDEGLPVDEQRLADVRYELESIERNLRNLDLQISYSTINLNLQEVEVYTPTVPVQRTFSEKLSDAFSDGWTGFVRGLQYFCLGLASSLPGLVLFVLIVLALFFLVRSILRKVKSGRKAKQEASQQPPEQDSKSE